MALGIACAPPEEEASIVAQVGDHRITAEDFRLNYAFGHGTLRTGTNPREVYLGWMIREQLLAQEAERRGLDTAAVVRFNRRTMAEELLVEHAFQRYVLDEVSVTDEEVEAAINRRAVQFQFRFIPALNERDGERIRTAWVDQGFESVLDARREALAEVNLFAENLISPLVRAADIEPDLLTILQELPVNTPSVPVQRDGQWFVFEVTDVRRDRLAPADYAQQGASVRKVLYNQKAMQQGTQFVADTMMPLDVITKREGFDVLRTALWAWYRAEPPIRPLSHYLSNRAFTADYAVLLRQHTETPLITFDDTVWTIADFAEQFTPGRYQLDLDDERAFTARLADVVALVVRDAVLIANAQQDRLDQTAAYQHELAQWTDHWRFRALRRQLGARDLVAFTDSLWAVTDVHIYRTVLDTLTIPVDDTRAQQQTVFLLKSHSNRPAFPVVDRDWGKVP
ncbi:MAG: hypothetical protein RhofKO_10870 [Rhodothermales bacterium]